MTNRGGANYRDFVRVVRFLESPESLTFEKKTEKKDTRDELVIRKLTGLTNSLISLGAACLTSSRYLLLTGSS